MGTTNVYLKDWHRRFAGQRFSFFEQFCLANGTTSYEALVTAAALRPQQTVLARFYPFSQHGETVWPPYDIST